MITSIKRSLADLLGEEYIEKLLENRAFLGFDTEADRKLAYEKVDFYPETFAKRQDELIPLAGKTVVKPFANDMAGATTNAYRNATDFGKSGIGALGWFRIGENEIGRAHV